jgi:hypothetical protein
LSRKVSDARPTQRINKRENIQFLQLSCMFNTFMGNHYLDSINLISRLDPFSTALQFSWQSSNERNMNYLSSLLLLILWCKPSTSFSLPTCSASSSHDINAGFSIDFPISKTIRHKNCYFCIPNFLHDDQNRQSRN